MDVPTDQKTRNCRYCDKKFDSDWALGGHIRIHRQHQLVKSRRRKNLGRENFPEEDDDGFSCFVCEDSFPTLQLLLGHTRNHHEELSIMMSEETSCLTVEEHSIDQNQDQYLNNKMIVPYRVENSKTRICIYCKMEFKSGKALGGHLRSHSQHRAKKLALKNYTNRGSGYDHDYDIYDQSQETEVGDQKSCKDLLKFLSKISKTHRRGRKRTINGETIYPPQPLTVCFPPLDLEDRADESNPPSKKLKAQYNSMESKNADSLPTQKRVNSNTAKVHQCEICGKTFETGQALGGHKTYHRNKETSSNLSKRSPSPSGSLIVHNEEQEQLPAAAETGMVGETTSNLTRMFSLGSEESYGEHSHGSEESYGEHSHPKKVLDFDLNIPYVEE